MLNKYWYNLVIILRNLNKSYSLKLKIDNLNQYNLWSILFRDQGNIEYLQWRKQMRLNQDKKKQVPLYQNQLLLKSKYMHLCFVRWTNYYQNNQWNQITVLAVSIK